jgi:hypothetical protein
MYLQIESMHAQVKPKKYELNYSLRCLILLWTTTKHIADSLCRFAKITEQVFWKKKKKKLKSFAHRK